MKYNVFKRPMFRTGGLSQGTGITSGLDTPRIGFRFGTGLAYGQQYFPDGFQTQSIAKDTSTNEGIPKIYNFKSEDPHQFRFPFSGKDGYFDRFKEEKTPPTIIPGVPGGGDPDMFYKKPVEEVVEEDTPSLIGKTPKSEEDILLEQLGDTSLSKGEKALMLSEIIGQKGWKGKTDKALELMKAKSKEDRQLKKDIAKLKYLQKGKEKIAGISAGALGSTEKTIEAAINARKAGAANVVTGKDGVKYYDGKTEAQIRNEIYKLQTAKEDIGEKLGGQILVRSKDEILGLKQKIDELESKETLSTTQQKQLDKKKKQLDFYKQMPGYELLYKEGGRVGYAQGTPMAEPQVAATQIEGANTTENSRPVNKLTFAELRNRLPKEITDDVVQLLAASEEALQDFAYIQTQEDINKFNVKYGVNVILPPQA